MAANHTESYHDGQPTAAPSDTNPTPDPTPPVAPRLLAVRFWRNVEDRTGTGEESLAWLDLTPKLTTHTELQEKEDGPLWSPTRYQCASNGKPLNRKAANVTVVSCLALDFDDGTPPEALEAQWQARGLAYAINSTHRHTAEHPRWRVVFPLTRDVAGTVWRGYYTHLAAALGCVKYDVKCKDPCRIFYLPSCPPGAERFARVNPGRFLDPDEFGAGSPVPSPAPAPAPVRRQTFTAKELDRICRRELDKALGEEDRDNACFQMACQLRDLGLSQFEVNPWADKFAERCAQPPHKDRFEHADARKCVRSAFTEPPRDPSYSQAQVMTPRASGADPAAAPDPEQLKAAAGELENDIGNGKRFARFHAADVRHTPELGWLVWDGRRWIPDEVAVAEAAKATALRIFHEVPHLAEAGNQDGATRRGKWAKQSGDRNRLRGMRECAATDPSIAARVEEFDTDLWLLNCLNGTVDLRTGTLRTHRREDLITRICPVEYDREARSKQWERFLFETTDGNRDLAEFLARAVGYSLTGSTREDALFFVHGPGGAGKSTFVEAVKAAMGGYALTANFESFLQRQDSGGPRSDIACLRGARFVAAIEVDEGKRLAEGLVKSLTGGDRIRVNPKYKDDFEFPPELKLWLVANHAPKVRDGDEALFRRLLRVPFEHFIPAESRDRLLREDLLNPALNGAAILAWAVRGCLDWQANGLRVPEVVTRATSEYRESQDLVKRFLADCCELTPDGWTSSGALKTAFDEWAKVNREKTLSAKALAVRFQAHGLEMKQAGVARSRGFAGVELVENQGMTLFGRPKDGGKEHMNGSEADSGNSPYEFPHVEDFPESGLDPFHVFTPPTAEDLIEDFA